MSWRLAPILAMLGLLGVACDRETVELSTTSSLVAGPTVTPAPSTTTTLDERGGTDSTLRGQSISDYQVTARIPTENGEVIHIVVPPGAYTDVDLENFLIDLKEADPDLWGAEVFDDPGGPDAFDVAEEERTEEENELLARHHLVSLIGGDTIRYRGPFSSLGESIIGS